MYFSLKQNKTKQNKKQQQQQQQQQQQKTLCFLYSGPEYYIRVYCWWFCVNISLPITNFALHAKKLNGTTLSAPGAYQQSVRRI